MFTIEEQKEKERARWAEVAKKHGWYKEPFYVQVWLNLYTNEVIDSVSFSGLEHDIVILEEVCDECGEVHLFKDDPCEDF